MRALATATTFACLLHASALHAAEPSQDDAATGSAHAGGGKQGKPADKGSDADADAQKKKRLHTELTVVPLIGGDSDVGFGGGMLASWARVSPQYDPYLARIEFGSGTTFKLPAGKLDVPYSDSYLLLDLPQVIPHRLRFRTRLSYTRETQLNYNGIGNAAHMAPGHASEYFEYQRVHPVLDVNSDYRLTKTWQLHWGVAYTQNALSIRSDSQLAADMRSGSPLVRSLLGRPASHGVLTYSYGIIWDDRDNEVSPHRGQHHTLRVDLSPGGIPTLPYTWSRVNLSLEFFVPIVARRLTFASRVLGDFLFGDAPFYELPRYDVTPAIGGSNGVRGIPAQRYYGKIKVFTNLELRSELFHFRLLGKDNVFGLTGFLDAGRVFTHYRPEPELDGSGLGLKYGVGGGPRLMAGKSFVVRLDVAWSKEATPIAGYLAAGHIF